MGLFSVLLLVALVISIEEDEKVNQNEYDLSEYILYKSGNNFNLYVRETTLLKINQSKDLLNVPYIEIIPHLLNESEIFNISLRFLPNSTFDRKSGDVWHFNDRDDVKKRVIINNNKIRAHPKELVMKK